MQTVRMTIMRWQTELLPVEYFEKNIVDPSNWRDQGCLGTSGPWCFGAHQVLDLEKVEVDPVAAPLSKLTGWDLDPSSTSFAPLFQALELEL